ESEENGVVQGTRRPHMACRISEVARRHEPIGSDLFLKTEIPLSHIHGGALIVHRRHDRERNPRYIFREVRSERLREWISAWIVSAGGMELDVIELNSWCPRRNRCQASLIYRCGIVIERPCRNTNRGAAVTADVLCESHSRREIAPLVVHARLAGKSRVGVEE